MKIVKGILIGLGSISAIIVAFGVLMAVKSSGFKAEQSDFITGFITEFSQNWEISDVQHMVSKDFMGQVSSQQAVSTLAIFRRFGKLEKVDDIELDNFKMHFGSNSCRLGDFSLKATFEGASAIVRISLVVDKEGPRVQGLHINPTTEINPSFQKSNDLGAKLLQLTHGS